MMSVDLGMKKVALSALLFATPAVAFGGAMEVEMVAASTTKVLEKFAAEEPAALATFDGVKSWISGSGTKVRVYFNENKSSIVYGCQVHHGDEMHYICSKE